MIPVFRPSVGKKELQAVKEVLSSGWLGLGPKTEEFEKAVAEYTGAKYAVGTNSATAALHMACLLVDIQPGDEVLVPAITFVSTALAVSYCGGIPVFVDVNPLTLNIDVEDAWKKTTERTRAIIPVHYGGQPCDMDSIWELAERHGLAVIEDAAHALGASYKDAKVGGLSKTDITCMSFHAVKNITTGGDGGMLLTNTKHYADRAKKLRWCGIDKGTWDRTNLVEQEKIRYGWEYDITELGYKYHMNDLQACIGLVQLEKLEWMNEQRRYLAEYYNAVLFGVADILLLWPNLNTQNARHNYVIKTNRRDKLHDFLAQNGVSTGVHYRPLYKTSLYKQDANCPNADSVWKQILTLPLYPDMTIMDVRNIISLIKEFYGVS